MLLISNAMVVHGRLFCFVLRPNERRSRLFC